MKQLILSQAIEGFLLEKQAQHLNPHTVADYTNAFRKLQACLGLAVFLAGYYSAHELAGAHELGAFFALVAADRVRPLHPQASSPDLHM
jgi:hypothetical protein